MGILDGNYREVGSVVFDTHQFVYHGWDKAVDSQHRRVRVLDHVRVQAGHGSYKIVDAMTDRNNAGNKFAVVVGHDWDGHYVAAYSWDDNYYGVFSFVTEGDEDFETAKNFCAGVR